MRERGLRIVAWVMRNWSLLKPTVARVASFLGGVAILHREIYEVDTPEPLLVFLGLWLVGIAPAQFFDGLKRLGQEAQGGSEKTASDAAPGSKGDNDNDGKPPTDQLKFDSGDA